MRCPHVRELEDVDVAVIGIPTDDAVSFRSGARFGPEAIRSASVLLRNYNPILRVNVAERLSIVDWGDAPTVPGYAVESLERTRAAVEDGGARGGRAARASGGDHTILLAELRALAAVHGPLGLIQLDSHHDLWDEYFGQKVFHGSIVRRAVEEGLIDPARSVQAGLRGSLYGPEDVEMPARFGIDALSYEELAALGPGEFSMRGAGARRQRAVLPLVRHRLRRPGVRARDGNPRGRRSVEPGGADVRPLTGRARLPRLRLRRGVASVRLRRAVTALVAANACFEMLSLLALRRGSIPTQT